MKRPDSSEAHLYCWIIISALPMTSQPIRYLIAALPPEPIAEQVWFYKRYVAETYGSLRGMRVLPHITYLPPFTLHELSLERVEADLQRITEFFQPEVVQMEGFSYFTGRKSHVIYVAVEKTERMQQQYSALAAYAQESLLLPQTRQQFTPHVTIAYRDLSEEKFQLAWPYFKDRPFSETMPLDHLWLLKHEGKSWEPMTRFDFRG